MMTTPARLFICTLLSWSLLGLPAFPSIAAIETARLQPTPAQVGAEYGYALAAEHPVWVVGAPGAAADAGEVHVLDCSQLACETTQTLTGALDTGFGRSLALKGDWLAVGQPDAQRVRLYRRQSSAWQLHSTLQPAVALPSGAFGKALAFDGNSLAIGAPNEQGGAGAVYLFTETAEVWSQQVRLGAPSTLRHLGHSIAMNGGTLAIGAPFSALSPAYAEGRVWVLTGAEGTWTEVATLSSPLPVSAELFGYALALQGDRLVVGRPGASQGTANQGLVDVFERDPGGLWSHSASIGAPAPMVNQRLGWSVALEGDAVLLGTPFALANQAFQCGQSNRFIKQGGAWLATDDAEHDRLPGSLAGFAVAMSAQRWMSGAPTFAETAGSGAGVAYWFDTVQGLFGHGFGLADISCLPEGNL